MSRLRPVLEDMAITDTPAETGFIHLRVRSAYSLLEGAIKAGKVGKLAADAGMPAVAVADRVNLFGALEFSEAAKGAGVQPLIACALPVTGIGGKRGERWAKVADRGADLPERGRVAEPVRPVVLGLSATPGRWTSRSVPWSKVVEHSEGLILLSGGPDGPVDPLFVQNKPAEAARRWRRWRGVFGDRFYVELQRHGLAGRSGGRARSGRMGLCQ